jgi:DNA-binding PadR family transcriptional regulator
LTLAVHGAAYTALDRLERNGLVSSLIGAPTAERGGRAKRFFTVTPRGLRAVKETQRALVALWNDVPQLREKHS